MKVQYGKDISEVKFDCSKSLQQQKRDLEEKHKVDF
jgi:hypothetical protein